MAYSNITKVTRGYWRWNIPTLQRIVDRLVYMINTSSSTSSLWYLLLLH
jgi:hypothetical protein